MPHIRVESFNFHEKLPLQSGEVSFLWYARNMEHLNDGLLGVKVDNIPFLLQVKPKNKELLLKAEKISRPSPNTLIKRALQEYLNITGQKPSYSNIANVDNLPLKKPLPSLKEIATFNADDLPDKEVWIEIGFGSGRHLLHQAKENQNVHLIGLEIHRPSLEQVMRRIDLEGFDNVWVIDYDARLFMELLPSNRIERIFVHFPVPWDKKPHRRVISDSFMSEAMRVLKPGGTLELRTDSDNYFHYSMEVFTKPKHVKLTLEKNSEAAVKSKYEERWLRYEKDIYEIRVESLEESEPKSIDVCFDFPQNIGISSLFKQKPEKAWIENGCFAHIERFYAINENDGLIRLSLGSFDRPEHKFILIENGKMKYYPHNPVRTETNHKAHQIILKWMQACKM
ncbi:tRNA (guanosine(46)-N7)-methyltransferase TrmB [Hydrogenimonas thermophila]|uniref:tRNA (guanosine(46)-N7)-methyltransferase TrmB n=1 Tax=Hydrogenimonas thermophila TaxID=223786 RepID=UPI002936E39B|nr:tRNA (guanosine(46)-N7)-methyltransferase TrmB [Hydrogenimonas thermophila]WOE69304.1 tRNA (guanosine(46)-N7)-methyltransferase TrmB [Hydrogenimonas thermophila]WOE71814.1 tRNA (guanosine(46)-N7)-methyltransferase TrmB [Hydrogenimonas thermophila]